MTTATLCDPSMVTGRAGSLTSLKPNSKLPLGEQLIRAEILTPDELETALSEQSSKKKRLGEVLVGLGLVSEEQLLPFVALQLGVPSVRLRDGSIDPQIVRIIPRRKAELMNILALFKVRNVLTIAMSEPQNLKLIDELERMTGMVVRPVLALQSAIERMIGRVYEEDFHVDAVTADLDQVEVELHSDAVQIDLEEAETQAEGSPIINLVNYIIVHAVRKGVSDIHIEPGHKHSSIRYRIDGQLREVLRPRKDFHPAIVSRIKVMAKMDIAEHRMPQDGRIHVVMDNREIDLRASTLPTILGEKIVLRILDRQNITFNLDDLGVPEHQLKPIKRMLSAPHGLMLVTGPTGSGKTTTLYSALELIKSVHRNIVTVEDPVEYQLELINQVHANSAASLSFASVLRSILRQDPDVIMIGEIRDAETAEIAIQAALTGHLVLSTLHTNDSAGAVTRLMDMGVAPYKIAAALTGVLAQRLLRTVCPNCKTQYYPTAETLQMIKYEGDDRRPFMRGEGCSECYDTGYRGRIGIYEVLTVDGKLREIMTNNPSAIAIRKWHEEQGGTSLFQEGLRIAEKGITNLDEVVRLTFTE